MGTSKGTSYSPLLSSNGQASPHPARLIALLPLLKSPGIRGLGDLDINSRSHIYSIWEPIALRQAG